MNQRSVDTADKQLFDIIEIKGLSITALAEYTYILLWEQWDKTFLKPRWNKRFCNNSSFKNIRASEKISGRQSDKNFFETSLESNFY